MLVAALAISFNWHITCFNVLIDLKYTVFWFNYFGLTVNLFFLVKAQYKSLSN